MVAGPARPTGRFTPAEDGSGRTRVTFSLALRPAGLMRLIGGMIAATMRSEVARLSALKADLERT